MLPFDDELGPFLAKLYNEVGGRVPDILYNFCNAADDYDQQFTIATAQPMLNLDILIFRNPKNVSNRIAWLVLLYIIETDNKITVL